MNRICREIGHGNLAERSLEQMLPADYPYTVRWTLAAGEHVFQARLTDGRTTSSPVRVLVQ